MTLEEFGQLHVDEQAQHVWETSRYLMNWEGQRTTANPYVADSFYAEIWYDQEQNIITAITCFADASRLDAYLKRFP
jgi:hypothetical protein